MAEFNFELLKCERCGVTTALAEGYCRQCGRPLKKRNSMKVPLYMVAGAIAFVVGLGSLVVVARLLNVDEAIGLGLLVVGGFVGAVANIWLVIGAFQEDALWGLACLLLPFAQFAFLFKHPERAIRPALLYLGSVIVVVVGITLAGETLFAG